jgi:RNA polymerase sigma factor for flagellar operon FliA
MLKDAHGVQILHYEDFSRDGEDGWHDISASEETSPLDALLASDLRQVLIDAIGALPEREKLLMSLCYEQGLNLKEIGAVLNVTEARVCQLRSQAIARIRTHLRDHAWQDLPPESLLAWVA